MPAKHKYTPGLGRRICDMIAEGSSLDKISTMPGMPSRRTACRWMEENPEFERVYEIARRQRTDALVDEAISIADSVRGSENNAEVQAARLAVDTRRWLASKLLPERFGDKAAVELTGAAGKDLIEQPIDSGKLAAMILSVLNAPRSQEPRQAVTVEHEPAIPVADDPVPALQPLPPPVPCPPLSEPHRVFDPSSGQVVKTLLSGEDDDITQHALRYSLRHDGDGRVVRLPDRYERGNGR